VYAHWSVPCKAPGTIAPDLRSDLGHELCQLGRAPVRVAAVPEQPEELR
jgi:hypothetical protein